MSHLAAEWIMNKPRGAKQIWFLEQKGKNHFKSREWRRRSVLVRLFSVPTPPAAVFWHGQRTKSPSCCLNFNTNLQFVSFERIFSSFLSRFSALLRTDRNQSSSLMSSASLPAAEAPGPPPAETGPTGSFALSRKERSTRPRSESPSALSGFPPCRPSSASPPWLRAFPSTVWRWSWMSWG